VPFGFDSTYKERAEERTQRCTTAPTFIPHVCVVKDVSSRL